MKKSIIMCAVAGIFIFFVAGLIFAQAGSGSEGSAITPDATSNEEVSTSAVPESGPGVTPAGEASPGASPSGVGTSEDSSDAAGCVQ